MNAPLLNDPEHAADAAVLNFCLAYKEYFRLHEERFLNRLARRQSYERQRYMPGWHRPFSADERLCLRELESRLHRMAETAQERRPPINDVDRALDVCRRAMPLLNGWEERFTLGVIGRNLEGMPLTDRQLAVVRKIAARFILPAPPVRPRREWFPQPKSTGSVLRR